MDVRSVPPIDRASSTAADDQARPAPPPAGSAAISSLDSGHLALLARLLAACAAWPPRCSGRRLRSRPWARPPPATSTASRPPARAAYSAPWPARAAARSSNMATSATAMRSVKPTSSTLICGTARASRPIMHRDQHQHDQHRRGEGEAGREHLGEQPQDGLGQARADPECARPARARTNRTARAPPGGDRRAANSPIRNRPS